MGKKKKPILNLITKKALKSYCVFFITFKSLNVLKCMITRNSSFTATDILQSYLCRECSPLILFSILTLSERHIYCFCNQKMSAFNTTIISGPNSVSWNLPLDVQSPICLLHILLFLHRVITLPFWNLHSSEGWIQKTIR